MIIPNQNRFPRFSAGTHVGVWVGSAKPILTHQRAIVNASKTYNHAAGCEAQLLNWHKSMEFWNVKEICLLVLFSNPVP